MEMGTLIGGRYRLEEIIGRGANGVVWRAAELLPDGDVLTYVAVKVFNSEVERRELQILATCGHPNILGYRAIAEHEGQVCLVAELADGGNVHEYHRQARLAGLDRLPVDQVERIILSMAEALDYLEHRHAQSPVIHRDIKPENVLLVGDTVKLGDVGTALAVERKSAPLVRRDTSRGLGTPEFTAPERYRGQVGPRSDVYSLGVTAFELLAGRHPFERPGEEPLTAEQLMLNHLQTQPEIPPEVPAPWPELIEGCLRKDPAERWDAAKVVWFLRDRPLDEERQRLAAETRELERLRQEQRRLARPTRPRWRSPVVLALAGVPLVAAFLGIGIWAFSEPEPDAAEASVEPPDNPPVEPPADPPVEPPPPQRRSGPAKAIKLSKVPGTWIRIEPGTFTMGSPEDEEHRQDNETQHQVTLTRPYLLMETEVTQGQFEEVMGRNPSNFAKCGRDCPVERVSWWDAVAYANALSKRAGLPECYELRGCRGTPGGGCRSGDIYCAGDYQCREVRFSGIDCQGYRLPTEAEWEYAARAGSTEARYGPVGDVGWYSGNSNSTTHPVKGKRPNAWGLYDMLGNVWEWCHDWYGDYPSGPSTDPFGPMTGSSRALRGGGWVSVAGWLRAAVRFGLRPESRVRVGGFRVAVSPPSTVEH